MPKPTNEKAVFLIVLKNPGVTNQIKIIKKKKNIFFINLYL